jgi:hypothetical protein
MHPRLLDHKGGGKQPRGHVKKYTTLANATQWHVEGGDIF